jgi:N-formylglutamate amidohydrolase
LILHIPHSSTKIKNQHEYTSHLSEAYELTDYLTDELFYHPDSEPCIFEFSRLYCDVERFIDDKMNNIGQGIIYTDYKQKLRTPSEETKKDIMKLYNNHHKLLTQKIRNSIALFPEVIVVDCHSFLDKPGYPDICIGINDFDNPSQETQKTQKTQKILNLVIKISSFIKSYGLTVGINFPYKGSILPEEFHNNKSINSIMIEVNKKLYLIDNKKSENFNKTKSIIYGILDIISEYEKEAK